MKHASEMNKIHLEDLLKTYSEIITELRRRNVVRSSNNLTSDYGEFIAARFMKLELSKNSNKGYDAIDKKGIRYQIKSRRVTRFNKSKQLGVIRNIKSNPFDFLVVVIFEEDFSIKEIWKIPLSNVIKHSRFSKHQNGNIAILNKSLITSKGTLRLL